MSGFCRGRGFAIPLLLTLGVAAPLQAGLVPVRVSVLPDGGYYRFTYAIVLPSDALLRPGDYFTIYDFDGFVPGSDQVGGTPYASYWSFSSSGTGPTPPGVLPMDDPRIPNLTWTYHGPVLGAAQTGLGNFWALSIYPDTKESWFTARTGTVGGYNDHNITPTTVPTPKAPPPAAAGAGAGRLGAGRPGLTPARLLAPPPLSTAPSNRCHPVATTPYRPNLDKSNPRQPPSVNKSALVPSRPSPPLSPSPPRLRASVTKISHISERETDGPCLNLGTARDSMGLRLASIPRRLPEWCQCRR